MANRKAVVVLPSDRSSKKWRISLSEDVFTTFIVDGGEEVRKAFATGSLFSPLLFGKFFDPADAFPLWDFEMDALLSGLPSSARGKVDWSETDEMYVLRAEIPGASRYNAEICTENGKVIEISRQCRESGKKDWRTGRWWEYGQARRLELPSNANGGRAEAYIDNDIFLEIRIPKNGSDCSVPEANEAG